MKIAYLSPEMPALSETFVYNELLEIEKNGITVVPLSVRHPSSKALEAKVQQLARRTTYLYSLPWTVRSGNCLTMLSKHPLRFFRAFFTAVCDAFGAGPFTRTAAGIIFRFFAASTVARILLEQGCSHIHAHFAHIPADIAMYASLLSGVPYSFTAHANDIFARGWLLKEKVARSAFTAVISEYNRDFLVSRGAPGDRIHVVHCGVDAGSFTSREHVRTRSPLRLGSLGRMVEKKGFDVLVDACRELKSSGIAVTLEIAGDGPLKQALTMKAYTMGLSKEVRFIGPIAHDRVPGWLRTLDAFVLPCRKDREGDMDGIPVVLMEAMLTGVPVVSTRLTGIPELIEDGHTGYLAEPGDAKGLAAAIARIITGKDLLGNLVERAIDKVRSDFDLSRNANLLAGLIKGTKS